ncbi:MAG: hypothetical protein RLZZ517_561 [Candidatus Parcubacteria bacterium]|jgi:uncharacterized protein YacL
MKKKIIILVVIAILLVVGYFVLNRIYNNSSSTQVFSTQEECQKNTGSMCGLQLCDYKCPRNFKTGWVKIQYE